MDLTGVLSAVKMKNLHCLRQESTSIGLFVQPTSIPFILLDVVHKYCDVWRCGNPRVLIEYIIRNVARPCTTMH